MPVRSDSTSTGPLHTTPARYGCGGTVVDVDEVVGVDAGFVVAAPGFAGDVVGDAVASPNVVATDSAGSGELVGPDASSPPLQDAATTAAMTPRTNRALDRPGRDADERSAPRSPTTSAALIERSPLE